MIYLAIIAIVLYYITFIGYYKYLMPSKGKRRLPAVATVTAVMSAYLFLHSNDLGWLSIPVITMVMIGGLRLSTGMNWLQAAYGGSFCVLSAYSFRGVFIAIGALLLRNSKLFSDINGYYIFTFLALPLGLYCLNILCIRFFPEEKIKQFLHNNNQLRLFVIYEAVAIVNLTAMNLGRYISANEIWYIHLSMGACLLTLSTLIYANYQAVQSAELIENQSKIQILEEHYGQQLQQYESCIKNVENFQAFKHDYRSMMGRLKSLIRMHEHDQAIQLLDNIYEDLPKEIPAPHKYSDNAVLNVILQDLVSRCKEKKIKVSFDIFVSLDTGITLVNGIRVFSNIFDNAIEACQKVPVEKRFITINSGRDDHWTTLEVVNAYDGELIVENGNFITTKTEKEKHGLGLCIVKEIVEEVGGFVIFAPDPETKIFLLRLHLPQINVHSKNPIHEN